MTEPIWLTVAMSYRGIREIPGPQHHPKILEWWRRIKRGGIKDDETPWCAAFVGGCLEEAGLRSSRFESARSYLSWGIPLREPVPGCIVVFERVGGGHVGFATARAADGRLMILGGNQSNQVSIAPFEAHRVVKGGYRWPEAVPVPNESLPVVAVAAASSRNEA